ncbi:MAG: NADPH-dependent oxidoreductase [Phycisphaerales bacterium]|nr:NADPH-dependent oxidoreductase [Phycisphaerales bacterium]
MNPTIELLHRHRSIRRYTDQVVPDEALREAVAAGQAASTSSAIQSYCVIHVRDMAKRRRLVELTGNQEKVAACGAFLAVCGDTRRHRLAAARDGKTYDARFEAFLLAVIDASLFAQNMVVALESMGYGICYIGGLRNRPFEVDELLDLPEGVHPIFGLCVGVPAEAPAARPRLPVDAVLFDDAYPDDPAVLAELERYDTAYERYLVERGAEPRRWSSIMADKFTSPVRADQAAYHRAKGARLD